MVIITCIHGGVAYTVNGWISVFFEGGVHLYGPQDVKLKTICFRVIFAFWVWIYGVAFWGVWLFIFQGLQS